MQVPVYILNLSFSALTLVRKVLPRSDLPRFVLRDILNTAALHRNEKFFCVRLANPTNHNLTYYETNTFTIINNDPARLKFIYAEQFAPGPTARHFSRGTSNQKHIGNDG